MLCSNSKPRSHILSLLYHRRLNLHSDYPGDTDIQGTHTGSATRPSPVAALLFWCPLVVLLSGIFVGRRERLEQALWYCAAAAAAAATPRNNAPVGEGLQSFGTSCWAALKKRVWPSAAARKISKFSAAFAKLTAELDER